MACRVDQIFRARVGQWSERPAIKAGDGQISYAALDRRSNRLARRLLAAGLQQGQIVAIAVGDIERFAVAVLAVLKCGCAYLPIDTRYPVERVRDILVDAAPAILLATADFPNQLIPGGLLVIHDFAGAGLDAYPDHAIEATGSAEDVACVYYTSGSTGRPKGILVAHSGIPSLVGDPDFLSFGPNDRIAQASNFAFDALTFELWGALLNGGCLVHLSRDILLSAPALANFLKRERITVIWLTTSLFNALSSIQPDSFETLQVLVIGGEAADPIAVGRVLRSGHAPRRLINAYGPTEATTFATWHEVTLNDVDAGRVPIGKPIRNFRIHIVDETMTAVRPGQAGELLIGGPGVAKGYLNRPDATHASFVVDPFAPGSQTRLYRTGDLCRELPDGNIEYLGRLDDQVKIRGFRVEPFEVATMLRRLPGVEEAVVLPRPAAFGTSEMTAFVRGSGFCSSEELRREAANLLPDYMVPSIIRTVDAFPMTANGKLDRAALLASVTMDNNSARHLARQDPDAMIENRLTAIYSYILQRNDISPDDDFHDLGGDSFGTLSLALEIEAAFGVVLPPDDVAPPLTVSGLAAQLRRRLKDRHLTLSSNGSGTSKVFAISYPWIMRRMPRDIGDAVSSDGWQQVNVPFTYFRSGTDATIEDMARQIERQICTISPEGPYLLFGHCIAGLLAYEVGQRLVADGRRVSGVIIVDSNPYLAHSWGRWMATLPRRLTRFARMNMREKLHGVRCWMFPPPQRGNRRENLIVEACQRAARNYRPRPFDGRVTLFRHRRTDTMVGQDPTAWSRLAKSYTEHIIDFHDGDVVTPEAVKLGYSQIAAKLKETRDFL
jgi:amino acid adenylation domain-containing protein